MVQRAHTHTETETETEKKFTDTCDIRICVVAGNQLLRDIGDCSLI